METKKQSEDCQSILPDFKDIDMDKLPKLHFVSSNRGNESWHKINTDIDNTIREIMEALHKLADGAAESCNSVVEAFKEMDNICNTEKSVEIAVLEEELKHCNNYLRKKQINRELNILKFKRRKKNGKI